VKGAVVRAYVTFLEREKLFDTVVARLEPEHARVFRNPPLVSTWVDGWCLIETTRAVQQLKGNEMLRRISTETTAAHAKYDFVQPFLQGIMRLFGVSPATLLSRFNELAKTSVEGMEFRYTASSPRSGVMRVRYDLDQAVPKHCWITTVAVFENVIKMCGADGTVSEAKILDDMAADYEIRW
jgi:hypothetical protein